MQLGQASVNSLSLMCIHIKGKGLSQLEDLSGYDLKNLKVLNYLTWNNEHHRIVNYSRSATDWNL